MEVPVTVVRVFCGPGGTEGNPLGVVLDGPTVSEDDRQALARLLGYSETVFVDDRRQGRIRIFTPAVELPLAGHPLVGTGWLLHREGEKADALLTPAGKVGLRHDPERPEMCWATARPEWCPPFGLVQMSSPEEVEATEPAGDGWSYVWAWIDQQGGVVRARCFVQEAGIPEDEATGSAALRLCAALDRPIEVRQGRGSVIWARPAADEGAVEIGGRVEAS